MTASTSNASISRQRRRRNARRTGADGELAGDEAGDAAADALGFEDGEDEDYSDEYDEFDDEYDDDGSEREPSANAFDWLRDFKPELAGSSDFSLMGLSAASAAALASKSKPKPVFKACVHCKRAHLACDNNRPCKRCVHLGKSATCVDVEHKKRGRPKSIKGHVGPVSNPYGLAGGVGDIRMMPTGHMGGNLYSHPQQPMVNDTALMAAAVAAANSSNTTVPGLNQQQQQQLLFLQLLNKLANGGQISPEQFEQIPQSIQSPASPMSSALGTGTDTECVCVLSLQGIFVDVGPEIHLFLGYLPTDLVGENIYKYILPDDVRYVSQLHMQCLSQRKGFISNDMPRTVAKVRAPCVTFRPELIFLV